MDVTLHQRASMAKYNVYDEAEPVLSNRTTIKVESELSRPHPSGQHYLKESSEQAYETPEAVRLPAIDVHPVMNRLSGPYSGGPQHLKETSEQAYERPEAVRLSAIDVHPAMKRLSGPYSGEQHLKETSEQAYETPEPVHLPPVTNSPTAPSNGALSPGRPGDAYEEAQPVVLRPGESATGQRPAGQADRPPEQNPVRQGVRRFPDNDKKKYPGHNGKASPLVFTYVTIVTVAVVILIAIVAVAMVHRYPSYQPPTPPWPGSAIIYSTGITLTSQNTRETSHQTNTNQTPTTSQASTPPGVEGIPADAAIGVAEGRTILFGRGGSGPGEFRNPRGVVVSARNEIFVADMFNRRVQVHDIRGVHLLQFPAVTPGGRPVAPEDISIDGDGKLWVVGSSAVVQHTREGRPLAEIALPHTQSHFLRGVAVNLKTGHIIVTEANQDYDWLLMYEPDGVLVRKFGAQVGIKHPWYVAADRNGNILVSDYDTHFIYIFDQSGEFISKFGGHFFHPEGLCTDSYGNIIVADSGNRRVEVLSRRGKHVRYIGAGLGNPSGVAVGPTGQLVVTYGLKSVVAIFTN